MSGTDDMAREQEAGGRAAGQKANVGSGTETAGAQKRGSMLGRLGGRQLEICLL